MSSRSFQEEILFVGKDFYQKVKAFVQANKNDDDKFYKFAVLRLPNDKQINFSFDESLSYGKLGIKIIEMYYSEDKNDKCGEFVSILPDSVYGFSIICNLYLPNKHRIELYIADNIPSCNISLPKTVDDGMKIVTYISDLYEQLAGIEYDTLATHESTNLTKNGRIIKCKEAVEKLYENNSQADFLPSVSFAADWCSDALNITDYVGEKGELLFKKTLSSLIMEELSQGYSSDLQIKDELYRGILHQALNFVGIDTYKLNFTGNVIVDIDSVKVRETEDDPYIEIFNVPEKDVTKKKKKEKVQPNNQSAN